MAMVTNCCRPWANICWFCKPSRPISCLWLSLLVIVPKRFKSLLYSNICKCKTYLATGVRVAAAESLPYLLECASIRDAEYVATMWQYICPELLKAVATEPEMDLKSEHMHSLGQVELLTIISADKSIEKLHSA